MYVTRFNDPSIKVSFFQPNRDGPPHKAFAIVSMLRGSSTRVDSAPPTHFQVLDIGEIPDLRPDGGRDVLPSDGDPHMPVVSDYIDAFDLTARLCG